MVLVRLIDVLVLYVRILGGRTESSGLVRVAAWAVAATLAALTIGLLGYLVAHLLDIISAITGETYD